MSSPRALLHRATNLAPSALPAPPLQNRWARGMALIPSCHPKADIYASNCHGLRTLHSEIRNPKSHIGRIPVNRKVFEPRRCHRLKPRWNQQREHSVPPRHRVYITDDFRPTKTQIARRPTGSTRAFAYFTPLVWRMHVVFGHELVAPLAEKGCERKEAGEVAPAGVVGRWTL